MKDFFISYTGADEKWAEWVGWQLEAAGYSTVLQAWDFGAGANFVVEMQRAASEASRTIAILSPDYLKSQYAMPEWAAALGKDPTGKDQTLIPIRVRSCELKGLLPQIVYIDLVACDAETATERLLRRVQSGRQKPRVAPAFPGTSDSTPPPDYPGDALSNTAGSGIAVRWDFDPARGADEPERYLKTIEDQFGFRWEPWSPSNSPEGARVYWPVRLRKPTPIHAIQCFAVAGLQKLGLHVALWLDDLGNCDCSLSRFRRIIDRWLGRVGGDPAALQIRMFSEVLDNQSGIEGWPMVQRWWSMPGERLEGVLRVSKLWPSLTDSQDPLRDLSLGRPRRLLTPALVWTCLRIMQMEAPSAPVITLGGYDERGLWEAWRNCDDAATGLVGHLYAPELLRRGTGSSEQPVHMSNVDLAWSSRQDVREALESELRSAEPDEWCKPGRLVPWSLQGCLLLPQFVSGNPVGIDISGKIVDSLAEVSNVDPQSLLRELGDELTKWLL